MTVTPVSDANVCAVKVIFASPAAVKVVISAATKEEIVEAVVLPVRLIVVKPSSAAASLSVIVLVVAPVKPNARILAVGVAVRAPREIPNVPPSPAKLTDVSALESIVVLPKFVKLTVANVPAVVVNAALASAIVTAPLVTPI